MYAFDDHFLQICDFDAHFLPPAHVGFWAGGVGVRNWIDLEEPYGEVTMDSFVDHVSCAILAIYDGAKW